MLARGFFFMPPPPGLDFGRKAGSLLAGHSLMIPGKPQSFSPLLGRHFFFVETCIRPAADALWFAHTISCYFSYPHRTDLAQLAQDDSKARLKAQLWWSQHATKKPFADPLSLAVRGAAISFHIGTLFSWFVVSAIFPGMVHQMLSTAAGITARKHEATCEGAPEGQYGFDYKNHSLLMYKLEEQHQAAAKSTFFCPFTACIALVWMLFFRSAWLSPPAQQQQQQSGSPFWGSPQQLPQQQQQHPQIIGQEYAPQHLGLQYQQQPPPPAAPHVQQPQHFGFGGAGYPGAGGPRQ